MAQMTYRDRMLAEVLMLATALDDQAALAEAERLAQLEAYEASPQLRRMTYELREAQEMQEAA